VGHVFQLEAESTEIGRDADNHIVVDDSKVSAFHCKVVVGEGKRLTVWDLASANGTLVNGERVTAPVAIQENDVITLGTTSLVLKTLE
jgi:pSer/pThr/pTyr-binding forkhead associated (FHA) protein